MYEVNGGVSELLFVFLIGLVIIAFAAFVYKQDGTNFTKLTNYSIFDLMVDKEARKLNAIYKALQKADGEYKILLNVHVQDGSNAYKIPALLIHESGVHVITDVDAKGWIVGSDRSIEWVNILYKNKKEMFNNPVLINRRYVYALRDNVVELPDNVFHSVVLFGNDCSFQKVEVSTDNVEVLKQKELKLWSAALAGDALNADDINTIYESLKDKMEFKKKLVAKKKVKTKKQIA